MELSFWLVLLAVQTTALTNRISYVSEEVEEEGSGEWFDHDSEVEDELKNDELSGMYGKKEQKDPTHLKNDVLTSSEIIYAPEEIEEKGKRRWSDHDGSKVEDKLKNDEVSDMYGEKEHDLTHLKNGVLTSSERRDSILDQTPSTKSRIDYWGGIEQAVSIEYWFFGGLVIFLLLVLSIILCQLCCINRYARSVNKKMDNAKHQMLINDRMLRLEMALLEQNLNKNPRIPTATATPLAVSYTHLTLPTKA